MYFDGTARGLTAPATTSTRSASWATTLYFSTRGTINPPGVAGAADDADIYGWNGTTLSQGRTTPRPTACSSNANVDGLVWQDATHVYLSFANAGTALPGVGTVQDEDVVHDNGGSWSVYFDGTDHGLGTSDGLDVDAFDLP